MNGQGIGTSSFADYCKRVEKLPLTKDERENVDNRWAIIVCVDCITKLVNYNLLYIYIILKF